MSHLFVLPEYFLYRLSSQLPKDFPLKLGQVSVVNLINRIRYIIMNISTILTQAQNGNWH